MECQQTGVAPGDAPLLFEGVIGEDLVHKVGAMARRVGVHRTRDRLDLRLNGGGLCGVVTHDGESANALAVHAHVLGVRLRQRNLDAASKEHLDRSAVALTVARREALHRKPCFHIAESLARPGYWTSDLGYAVHKNAGAIPVHAT